MFGEAIVGTCPVRALASFGYGISFPLLALSLERMGVAGQMIGLNAAMPALGWLIGSTSATILPYTFSAFAVGSLVFPVPLGILSDHMNRVTLILVCALASIACAALLPFLLIRPLAFLVAVAVWSGFAGGIYSIALSIIGDHAQGAELARGNASMGVVYAAGSPLDTLNHTV